MLTLLVLPALYARFSGEQATPTEADEREEPRIVSDLADKFADLKK
jgi:hypothetical protein